MILGSVKELFSFFGNYLICSYFEYISSFPKAEVIESFFYLPIIYKTVEFCYPKWRFLKELKVPLILYAYDCN